MTPEDDDAQAARERWLRTLLQRQGLELEPARLAELARAQVLLARYTDFLRQASPVSVRTLGHTHDA
ncbi:hypothetical protein [Pseudomonas kuykendallii]|uniref:Uncharacterized protein n=1 Tax=Pseudomonas kuykendallii TaxID=1007099 RepID=A0A2W5F0F1_9PSED|nr:hypothetical protein [Pseudomonas kuykendallii]PZP25856.1 MAG: hypothetical protein DI599_04375 [Pseudomonas kuykendallii]